MNRYLISDLALTDLLGRKIGIDYKIKAHRIIDFLKKKKEEMLTKIPLQSGEFEDGRSGL